jgi:hemerythrin superfamily protein
MVAASAAAIGLITGLAAAAGKRMALHAAESMTGEWADALEAEHLMIIEIFDLMDFTDSSDGKRRRRLVKRLYTALERHAFQEESVIYPAASLAGDREGAARMYAEHAETKVMLYELTQTDPEDECWPARVKRLRAALEAHFREEEDEIFPALQASLDAGHQATLTEQLHRQAVALG